MAGRNASMCVCFSCLNVTLGTSRYMARLRSALEPVGFFEKRPFCYVIISDERKAGYLRGSATGPFWEETFLGR